jgi:hypothetical protein
MRTTFRVIACVCLMALAVTMAAFTLAGFQKAGAGQDGALMLGAWQGSVAVFDRGDPATPLRVTDIELKSLRATDRALVEHGIPVASGEALQALLEDLGS